jgi:hypothetical protein
MITSQSTKKLATRSLLVVSLALGTTEANAGMLMLRAGPPSVGSGGANPIGIPPSAVDLELAWVSESNWETSLSAVPGLLFGKRFDIGNFYVGLGGGIVISSNGVGLGPYSSFGWETEGTVRVGIEYKQALGISNAGLISPSALRLGLGYVF